MRTEQPGHLRAFDHLGLYRYFLTFCTDYRQPFFKNAEAVTLVLSQISRAAIGEQFALLAYCFMPDHLHLLIEGSRSQTTAAGLAADVREYPFVGSETYSIDEIVEAIGEWST